MPPSDMPVRRLMRVFQGPQTRLWPDGHHVAGDHLAVRRLQQVVDARRVDDQPVDHPFQRSGFQPSGIGLDFSQFIRDGRIQLFGHEAVHRPCDDAEQQQPGDAEDRRIQDGQPEAGGAKRSRQAHGCNTRCRARC